MEGVPALGTEPPEPASATSQASSTAARSATAAAPAAEAGQSPRKGQAADGALAAGVTQLGKRQLPDPLAAATPAQRRQLPSSAAPMVLSTSGELHAAHDAASAPSKPAAAFKWEDDMINWSI